MRQTFKILLFTLCVSITSNAQQKEHLSGFGTISLTYKFDKNWYTYLETQGRSIADFGKIDYYEIKGGTGYTFNGSNQAFVGLGRYANYTNSKLSREELRVWLQYVYSKFVSKLKIEQRVRAEKRFFHNPVTDVNTNSERFRYRLNLILPLNNPKIEPKTFFANTYGELFLTTDHPTISRNRLFAGGGYQFSNSVGMSLGYLFQRDFNVKNTNTHFLFCGLNFIIDRSKSAQPSHIVTPDAD